MTATVVAAPAKINLALHVVGKRPDGYHLLDSLVAFTAYGDSIAVEPADRLSLAIDGPFAPLLVAETDNLVLRAARALAEAGDVPAQAAIRLTKNLPVASGIGGGSSDAAATLHALARLWRIGDGIDLAALGLALGADLPVCLARRTMRVEGIGERLSPLPRLPRTPIVLANPGIPLPTPAVFKARRGGFGDALPDSLTGEPARDAQDLARRLAAVRNDLTEAAIAVEPAVAEVLDTLHRTDGAMVVRMCGSGATCYALYPTDDAASRAAHAITATRPGWWCIATTLGDN